MKQINKAWDILAIMQGLGLYVRLRPSVALRRVGLRGTASMPEAALRTGQWCHNGELVSGVLKSEHKKKI